MSAAEPARGGRTQGAGVMTRRGLLAFLFVASLCAPLLLRGEEDPARNPQQTPSKPLPKPKDEPPRPDQKTKLTGMKGFEKAKGSVRYRDRPDERELDVDASKLGLPYGTKLTVLVNGFPIGEMEVGLLHGAKLKLRGKDKDVIPFVTLGTAVLVRTKDKPVLSGKF